jgi:hypothetical protein
MVAHSRTSSRSSGLRPLNTPRPIQVLTGDGLPIALSDGGQRRRIQIEDSWQIDDEWWRDPINRRYYRVRLDDGSIRTLYEDRECHQWFAQTY